MKNLNKSGQTFEQLGALAVGIGILAITLVIAFLIMAKGKSTIVNSNPCENTSNWWNTTSLSCCVNSTNCANVNGGTNMAYNSTNSLQNATSDVAPWVPIIVICIVGSVILGIVAMFRNR